MEQSFCRKILLPIDSSDCSKVAASYALKVAELNNAELHVIHIVDETTASAYAEQKKISRDQAFRQLVKEGKKMVEEVVREAAKKGLATKSYVRTGVVVEQIVQAAEEFGADLIVMGTHGRTGSSRMIVGSVAEKVIRHAPCPVLVIRCH